MLALQKISSALGKQNERRERNLLDIAYYHAKDKGQDWGVLRMIQSGACRHQGDVQPGLIARNMFQAIAAEEGVFWQQVCREVASMACSEDSPLILRLVFVGAAGRYTAQTFEHNNVCWVAAEEAV